jgi:hypothetical protein
MVNTPSPSPLLTGLALLVWAVPSAAEILPADRIPPAGTWGSAGVEGGIPPRTTICADVTTPPYDADPTGATSAVAAIQAAIDDCSNGEVVWVPAGTYLIDDRLSLRTPITLRGAGAATVFRVTGNTAVEIGGLGPWPPPKANAGYFMEVTGGATRGSTTVTVSDTSEIDVGKMIAIDEADDPALVWTKNDSVGRYRSSMHMVEAKTATSVTFRPPLPIDYTHTPHLARYPDLVSDAGVESIKLVGTGSEPGQFINIWSAWNVWVYDCEFTDMPSKTVVVGWSAHVELRKNFMHDQSNGGPNSEGLDLLCDVSQSLVVDNICVAAGFPQINIGDGGANPYYSGGSGNVIAYNYAVNSFYTDPPTSVDHWKMTADIGTNHSPHPQYNLVEGNYTNKFHVDSYHGSGSHTVLLRNLITGRNDWEFATTPTAVQLDRRNLYYALVGNVLGQVGSPTTYEYVTQSGWSGSTIYRLGFPDGGNDGFSGTHPPDPILHADGGPRDLYVDRDDTTHGTTLIEGNWVSHTGAQDWTIPPEAIPASLFLGAKPSWFGSLAWPPVDPAAPVTDDPTIIPAGYRYVHGSDPPPEVATCGSPVTCDVGETCANCPADCGPCCGNSVLDSGETCDPGITSGPGTCPVACDDGNACTTDALVGAAASCTAACLRSPIVACSNGDGCCPAGCNSATDGDCAPGCGDLICGGGETCGTCPGDCAPGVGEVCCADVVVTGDCCVPGDCGFGETCVGNACEPIGACADRDGDGHRAAACGGDDCDDTDAGVAPGVAELCRDGIDNDCDALSDELDREDCGGKGRLTGGCSCGGADPRSALWLVALGLARAADRTRRRAADARASPPQKKEGAPGGAPS